jgi:hypothetical protein
MDRLYLASFVGDGTHAQPFQPVGTVGLTPPWSMVDLRANPAAVGGVCLLATPNVLAADPGLTFIGDDKAALIRAADASTISSRTGVPVSAGDTIESYLQSLLFVDRGTWKTVQPSRSGVREIIFNGVEWTADRVAVIASARKENTMGDDNANRANENPLAGNWTTITGVNALAINSTQFSRPAAGVGAVRWNPFTPTDDQFSQIYASILGTNADWGVICRSDGSDQNYYFGWAFGPGESIQKFVAGTETQVAAITTTNLAVGQILRLECEGSTLRWVKNGIVQGSGTDTSLIGGSVGFTITPTNTRLRGWRGGDIASLRRINAGGFFS